ncbi:ATP-dependent exoDNAse (exonuclease V) beta subunit (contains helicase and exonuclease domains) [Algoriphagus locisalis]|uniref:DNA 3'-5' helicase n=1 Tax=Algoriphagus locisalis TaxID=305507 RepID=A0A1I7BGY2_9BACT|nr:UvrD-helicase domain-containing protein [Algoriphagus locisalis]SFT86445.1 ATP-dependent exoDNAse (exonuclease V) beta subunit (contains helicase and exonuclease domains) [Algoriphagus locisalis]
MEQRPFIIYKSSAGSGKTYTLTLEYLKLALQSPHAFKQILAVTFTNKATQEMKERILKDLTRLSREIIPSEFLDQELMKFLNMDEQGLQHAARETLLDILHGYGYFAVSTIDSFFQRVIRSFAKEMDLQAKFELELDQAAVLDRLVDRVVEQVSSDQNLKKWLTEYAEERIEEGKSWDIRSALKGLGSEIFKENFKGFQPIFEATIAHDGFLADFRKVIVGKKEELIDEALDIKNKAHEIRVRYGLEWTDFSGAGGTNNFAIRLDRLGNEKNPITSPTESQLLKIEGVETWYTKTSKLKNEIESAADAGLRDLLKSLPGMLTQWNTLMALSRNLNAFGVFRNLIHELRELKDEESILMISDVNDFLKGIVAGNEAPFIYEKIGNQYRNFLIDEFQDTSEFQWSSFKPLLVNSLGTMNTNLLVGDVKQSIYRWRGGRLELLLHEVQEQISDKYQNIKNLSINFRSLPNVVSFNNSLFSSLPELMQEAISSEFKVDSLNLLSDAFKGVSQDVPKKKLEVDFQGKIHVEFTQKAAKNSFDTSEEEEEDEEGDQNSVLDKLVPIVKELQDRGYEPRDIAFLVRKNQQGADIADKLMSYAQENPDSGYRFDVLSEESLFLSKSAAVKAVIALLNYLGNPADLVPLKTFWFYYALIHELEYSHELFEKNSLPIELLTKQKYLVEHLNRWLQLPLMEQVEEIIKFLDVYERKVDLAYVSGVKEAAFDFVKKNRADLQGFLDWWELNQFKRTVKIPEDHNAMRILTIHKSKGLQYKAVIVPYLDWKIVANGPMAPIIWSEYAISDSLKTVLPLTHQSSLLDSEFVGIYGDEVRLAYLDTLNMLYVAFTRAEEVLYGFADFSQTSKGVINLKQSGNILYTLFAQGFSLPTHPSKYYWDEEKLVFDWGEWPVSTLAKELVKATAIDLKWDSVDWRQKLKTREYAWDFSESGIQAREHRRLGVLIHEILEQAQSLEMAIEMLQSFVFDGRIDKETQQTISTQLIELFELPQFKYWYADDLQAMSEQGILLPGGKQKRPDRILVGENQAMVIDFKTGEKASKHELQVKEYMELVQRLTDLPTQGFLCYLEPTEIFEIK